MRESPNIDLLGYLNRVGISTIQPFCGEGFGRSQIGTELMRKCYPGLPVEDPCGIRPAQSGRDNMVPGIIELISNRFGVDISLREPLRMQESMFNSGVLAIGFVEDS